MEGFEHKVKPIGPAQGMIAPQDASVIHRHPKVGHHGRHKRRANREKRKYL